MPVIGSTDGDDIDIFFGQQLSVILAAKGGATKGRFGLIADIFIHVADCNDITVYLSFEGNDASLIAKANRTDAQTLVGGLRFIRQSSHRHGMSGMDSETDAKTGQNGTGEKSSSWVLRI